MEEVVHRVIGVHLVHKPDLPGPVGSCVAAAIEHARLEAETDAERKAVMDAWWIEYTRFTGKASPWSVPSSRRPFHMCAVSVVMPCARREVTA
jgi:hypothetical protein